MLAPLNHIIRHRTEVGKTVESGEDGHIQHIRRQTRLAEPGIDMAKVRTVVRRRENASAITETEALFRQRGWPPPAIS